jgi:hypothetical protein
MKGKPVLDVTSILQHSPNGIVLVDKQCRVQSVNPAFRCMFTTIDDDPTDRPVAELLHSDCFERAFQSEGDLVVRGSVPEQGIYYRATLFRVADELCCGIFVDTTEEERARAELSEVRRETLARAQEVIRRQMQTAQEIAGLLGETTAETKVLLAKLTDLFHQEGTP